LPKKTADAIVLSGNDYVLQVKGNQKGLAQTIAAIAADDLHPAAATCSVEESSRGKKNNWKLCTYDCTDAQLQAKWPGLKRFIVILKTVFGGDKTTQEKHYYITSTTAVSAEALACGIRGHWGIENKLHRTRDVHFKQDKNKIKDPLAGANVCFFNTLAINFLLQHIHKSIDFAQMLFAQNFKTKLVKLRT
jgi:predicted transposase YbfD/YdcC